MKNFLRKNWIYVVFAVAGAIGGYFYWYFIGCNSGTCPLTSKWYTTGLYGALLGYLSGDLLISLYRKTAKKKTAKDSLDQAK